MQKFIAFSVIIFVLWFVFFKKRTKKDENISDFVCCDKCKTFVDLKKIVKIDDKYICKDCENDSNRK